MEFKSMLVNLITFFCEVVFQLMIF